MAQPLLLLFLALVFLFAVAFHGDAQGPQPFAVVLAEGRFALDGLAVFLPIFCGNLIQTDGGFQHQQHVESLFADVLDDAGNLLALNDRLVNRLSKLLNQFAQTGCQKYLQEGGGQRVKMRGLRNGIDSTLRPYALDGKPRAEEAYATEGLLTS